MKEDLSGLKEKRKFKERQRVLDNFYTKQMKNGKTTRADILDKVSLGIVILVLMVILLNKIIGNFFISLLLGSALAATISIYLIKVNINLRDKKIEQIKREYKIKLEEEKVLLPDEEIEDYIVTRYYEKKSELKSSIKFLSKDKIVKLYFLFFIFYFTSYFVTYPNYYKIMAIISFATATFIGSYNITEYMRKKNNKDLLK